MKLKDTSAIFALCLLKSVQSFEPINTFKGIANLNTSLSKLILYLTSYNHHMMFNIFAGNADLPGSKLQEEASVDFKDFTTKYDGFVVH